MYVLITYDVDTTDKLGQKRLRKVAKLCTSKGQRVQNSVFECDIDASQLKIIKAQLSEIIDFDKDSIRFYYLGNNYKSKIEHFGAKQSYDPESPILI